MPKKIFALKRGGSRDLVCSWGFGWKNFTIKHRDEVIGTVPNQKELKEGKEFQLSDGSKLFVRLKIGLTSGLYITRDGKPVPGSDSDPMSKVKGSFAILMVIACVNIIIGVLAAFLHLEDFGLSAWAIYIIFGLIFLILSIAVRKASLIALIIAIVLLILDALIGIAFMTTFGGTQSVVWIVIRIFFLIYLITSVKVFKKLKTERGKNNF